MKKKSLSNIKAGSKFYSCRICTMLLVCVCGHYQCQQPAAQLQQSSSRAGGTLIELSRCVEETPATKRNGESDRPRGGQRELHREAACAPRPILFLIPSARLQPRPTSTSNAPASAAGAGPTDTMAPVHAALTPPSAAHHHAAAPPLFLAPSPYQYQPRRAAVSCSLAVAATAPSSRKGDLFSSPLR